MKWSNSELMLFKYAHCPFLTYKEKWHLALESVPELNYFDRDFISHKGVAEEKRASFLRYEKIIPIMQLTNQYKKLSIQCVSILSPLYPYQLKHSFDPPLMLFCKGDLSLLTMTLLGVVGARECTPYAGAVLDLILPDVTSSDIGIVSGLAKGVDVSAHKHTMTNGGRTIAVIGTGLDYFYPASNRGIQEELGMNQLVLTEYPLHTPPKKHHFPSRNRIIAGLSRGVLVVEAKRRSGSLITARMALEEGRDVFAVPGSIMSDLSAGCNDLIKSGAIPCSSAADILDEWNV